MTHKAKKIYIIISRVVSAVVAVAAVILGILYFAVDSLKEVFLIKNFPIITVCVSGAILIARILVEDVIFHKDFNAEPDKINTDCKSDISDKK